MDNKRKQDFDDEGTNVVFHFCAKLRKVQQKNYLNVVLKVFLDMFYIALWSHVKRASRFEYEQQRRWTAKKLEKEGDFNLNELAGECARESQKMNGWTTWTWRQTRKLQRMLGKASPTTRNQRCSRNSQNMLIWQTASYKPRSGWVKLVRSLSKPKELRALLQS